MKKFPDRDLEQLSAYLDGQLSSPKSAQVESHLASDPEFASALDEIRTARSILRKLPARKAPRNFTLTRQMVGLKPPLPRSYFAFRFSSTFAALLLIFTFAANALAPRVSLPAEQSFSFASGGSAAASKAPAEAPAPEAAAATEAPAIQAPSSAMAVAPTAASPAASADSAREIETPAVSNKVPVSMSASSNQSQVRHEALIPVGWQIGLLILGLISAIIAFVINQNAKKKWS